MYSFLAADVNEDGNINHEDLDILTELFSGEEDEWPRERQWVFYNAKDLETVTGNPLNENIRYQIFLRDEDFYKRDLAFTGVLKGNLNEMESNFKNNAVLELRNDNNLNVVIYPNPFTETIAIDNPTKGEMKVSIYGLDGRLMFTKTTNDRSVKIENSTDWNVGTYLYKVVKGTDSKTGKVIKM